MQQRRLRQLPRCSMARHQRPYQQPQLLYSAACSCAALPLAVAAAWLLWVRSEIHTSVPRSMPALIVSGVPPGCHVAAACNGASLQAHKAASSCATVPTTSRSHGAADMQLPAAPQKKFKVPAARTASRACHSSPGCIARSQRLLQQSCTPHLPNCSTRLHHCQQRGPVQATQLPCQSLSCTALILGSCARAGHAMRPTDISQQPSAQQPQLPSRQQGAGMWVCKQAEVMLENHTACEAPHMQPCMASVVEPHGNMGMLLMG